MMARSAAQQQYAQHFRSALALSRSSTSHSRTNEEIVNNKANIYLAQLYNATNGFTWPDYGIQTILDSDEKITILDFEKAIEESFENPQPVSGGSIKKQKGGVIDVVGPLIAKVLIKVLFELPEILENWSETAHQASAASIHAKNMDLQALKVKCDQIIAAKPSFFINKQIIENKATFLRSLLRTEYDKKIRYVYETELKYYDLQLGNVSGSQYAIGDQGAVVNYTVGDLIFDTLLASGVLSEASFNKHVGSLYPAFSTQTSEELELSFVKRVKKCIKNIRGAKGLGWK